MAEIAGAMNILNKALPTGADGVRLAQWELRANRTFGSYMGDVANALGALNQELMNKWGWLVYITEEQMFEYMTGGSVTPTPMMSDLDLPDPTHAETISHMIDLFPYGESIGGTKYFFRDAREATMDVAIRANVDKLTWAFEQTVLNRLFLPTEVLIGSSGYNVGFTYGTDGNVDFTPPAFSGEAFSSSHSHYLGVDTDSYGYDDGLNQMAEHLEEHGHTAPFTALVSRSDVSSYRALPGFVQPLDSKVVIVDRGTTSADTGPAFYSRDVNRDNGVIGGFESEYGHIELRATARIPTTYQGLVKSYGQNNERNPIAIRVHPENGFGARITAFSSENDLTRLKKMLLEFEFGVGVGNDRTNGVAAFLDSSGSWSNPTIT